jgi:hypothetical protein
MELYKYCKTEHMNALMDSNTLRLGTVFDWRVSGKYGEMVMDSNEGTITLHSGNVVSYDWRFVPDFQMQSSVEEVEGGRNFHNTLLYTTNVYSFSAAASYSKDDHVRWFESEGYDSCYKINSARLFFRAISGALKNCAFVVYDKIQYYDPTLQNLIFEGTFHPALLKHKEKYGNQNEVRAIWKPTDKVAPIAPVCLTMAGISKYCERHRTLDAMR